MANLRRHIAPIDHSVWAFIDNEARRILNTKLTGRKVVDFVGPKGADFAAVNTGRKVLLKNTDQKGITFSKRHVLPIVEVEVPFKLNQNEIDSFMRGAEDIDTDSLINAAKKVAEAEDKAIYFGIDEAQIKGILDVSTQKPVKVEEELISPVATAVKQLIGEGIEGPYNLVLGPEFYSLLFSPDEKGYPQKNRIEALIGGSIIPSPILGRKGVLVPQNSSDFELISGEDISIGYSGQQGDELAFFFIESFTFRVNAPEAAVILE